MAVLNKKSFTLPYIERSKFSRLLRLGLEYNRSTGKYSIKSYDKIEELTNTLSSILKDEVLFLQKCLMCSKAFSCSECNYSDDCSTKNLPFECVCQQCLKPEKTHHQKTF